MVVQALLEDPLIVQLRRRDRLSVAPIEGRHMQPVLPLVLLMNALPISARVSGGLLHFDPVRLFVRIELHNCRQVGNLTKNAADVILGVTDAHEATQLRLVLDDAIQ